MFVKYISHVVNLIEKFSSEPGFEPGFSALYTEIFVTAPSQ